MGFMNAPLVGSKAHPEHPIYLTNVDIAFDCDGCGEPGVGLCYLCKDPSGMCGKVFHVECGRPEEMTSHPFSKGCQFQFTYFRPNNNNNNFNNGGSSAQGHKICDACCTEIKGFYYVCKQHKKPDGHFIHPSCITLENRTVVGEFHLELKDTAPGKCGLCEHKHAFNNLTGWSYCGSEGRCLHIKCVKQMFLDEWRKTIFGATSSTFTRSRLNNIDGDDSGQGSPLLLLNGDEGGTSSATWARSLVKTAVPVFKAIFGKSGKSHAGVIVVPR